MAEAEHDPIECFHSYLDDIVFRAVTDALKRGARHRDNTVYIFKGRVYDEVPNWLKQRLGIKLWKEAVRQSISRLQRRRLIDDVSKRVNHEASIALVNPLEALADFDNA